MSLFGLRPEEPAAIRIREAATRGTPVSYTHLRAHET